MECYKIMHNTGRNHLFALIMLLKVKLSSYNKTECEIVTIDLSSFLKFKNNNFINFIRTTRELPPQLIIYLCMVYHTWTRTIY